MPNFDWSSEICSSIDEQKLVPDTLDRSKYAEFLTGYLSTEGNSRNFVLNLNAEWGAGKSYFLKRWFEEIKNDYPVVYIDAWSQDFSDDPLLTAISSIIEQLETQDSAINNKIIEIKKDSWNLIKASAPLLAKGLLKKLTGASYDDFKEAIISSDSSETDSQDSENGEQDGDSLAADLAYTITNTLIEDHQIKLNSIKHFKASIIQLMQLKAEQDGKSFPAFIFIDELDRCRPTYAIEMLETIKHLFDLKNIVFVVATDTNQLQHSIKVVYGNDFNADGYLGRFFHRRLTLATPDRKLFIRTLPQFENICDYIISNDWEYAPFYYDQDDIAELLANFFNFHDLNLRSTEKIIDQLASIIYTTAGKNICIDLVVLVALLSWKEKSFPIYSEIKKNPELITERPSSSQNILSVHNNYAASFTLTLKYYMDNLRIVLANIAVEPNTIDTNVISYISTKLSSLTTRQSPEIYSRQHSNSHIRPLSPDKLQIVVTEAIHEEYPDITLNKYFDLVDLAAFDG